jgi:NADPH:quinone reductase
MHHAFSRARGQSLLGRSTALIDKRVGGRYALNEAAAAHRAIEARATTGKVILLP